MLPSGMTPEDYIQILVNYETPNPYVRLSHLITTLLKPIVPIDAATPVQAVVDTLIAA
jgi:hypothetical protein